MTAPAIETTSPEETRALGRRLGAALQAGDVVLLSGELGAGKTVFVQGLAEGAGYNGRVSSKSFVLMGEYRGRVKLYHADLYRLETPEEADELALDEVSADGALAVEWPERAEHVLPQEHLLLCFEVTGEDTRIITPEATGPRAEELMQVLQWSPAR